MTYRPTSYLLLLVAFLLALAPLRAQTSVWKVTKGDATLYLGGTCHLLRPGDYPLPPAFDAAYAAADKLVFEIDPAAAEDPAFAMKLMAKSRYSDGRTLRSVLSDEAYNALAEEGQKRNLSIEAFNSLKPGLVALMITLQELNSIGVTQEGVDAHFAKRATADKKPIASLETVDFQIDLITNLGEGMESEIILFTLQDLKRLESFIDQMIRAWRTGDTAGLETLFITDMKQYPKLYDTMLADRNAAWLPQIERMLGNAEVEYVLVGAAHMAGEEGLLTLLENAGYSLEQLGK